MGVAMDPKVRSSHQLQNTEELCQVIDVPQPIWKGVSLMITGCLFSFRQLQMPMQFGSGCSRFGCQRNRSLVIMWDKQNTSAVRRLPGEQAGKLRYSVSLHRL